VVNARVRADFAALVFLVLFPPLLSGLGKEAKGDPKALLVVAMLTAAVIFDSRPGTGASVGRQLCGF
jgi:hypothetical protein